MCFCFTFLKVKCTLVQALRLYTSRTVHRGSRGIALLFLDHGTRRGEGSASRSGRSVHSCSLSLLHPPQLNAHNMLNTNIHHQLTPLHDSVFVIPSSGRPLCYLLKNYGDFAMLLQNVKYTLLFKFTMLLQYLTRYVFRPSVS